MPMSLKASCSINLGFPYHQHKTPAQSLSCLSSFLNEQKENGTKIDAELGNDHGARLLEDKMAKLLGTEAALWFPTGPSFFPDGTFAIEVRLKFIHA